MNNYFSLIKVMLKNGVSLVDAKSKPKNRKWSFMLIVSILIIGFAPMSAGLFVGTRSLYDLLGVLGLSSSLIISTALNAVSLMVLFFALFIVPSVYYYSRDVENLLPLPLKPEEIILSKFTVTLLYEYLADFLMLFPVLLGYGLKAQAGPVYWIFAVFVFLALPIAPLVYASVLNMLIMRFTSFAKNKNVFSMIGGVIALFSGLGINFAIQSIVAKNNGFTVDVFIQGNKALSGAVDYLFPGNAFAAGALANGSFAGFAILIGILAAMMIIFTLLAKVLYFKGVIGITDAKTARKAISEDEMRQVARERGIMSTYTFKEIKLLLRTPIYFLNCVVTNFLWPIIILLPIFAIKSNVAEQEKLMAAFKDISAQNPGVIMAVGAAIGVMLAAFNCITSSAISREGKNFFFVKYIPLSYRVQLNAKVFSGIFFSLIGSVALYAVIMAFLPVPAVWVLASWPFCALGIVLSSYAGIIIDVSRPLLVWDEEQKPVKQNVNVIISMGVAMGISVLIVVGALALKTMPLLTAILLTALLAAADYAAFRYSGEYAIKRFAKID